MASVKDERLQIRLDLAEKHVLERAAAEHQNVSSFVLHAAASRAEEILAERSVIAVSPRGAEARAGMRGRRRSTSVSRPPHDRNGFDCGEPALDEWLGCYAGQHRRRDTAATWVIADLDGHVVAYASLAMTAIDRIAASDALAKRASDPIPALLLGRLAVDRRHAGAGIGTALVAHVLATAVELDAKAACRAVVVTAMSKTALRWWERLGFQSLDREDLGAATSTCSRRTSRRRSTLVLDLPRTPPDRRWIWGRPR